MLKNLMAKSYKNKFAKKDAELLLAVLGNEEMVNKVITEEAIEGGKWEYVFDELYLLLNKEDAKILKGFYFDIVKRGDVEVLWEGFPHHEAERFANIPDPMEEFIDEMFVEASKLFDFDEFLDKLQAKMDNMTGKDAQELIEEATSEPSPVQQTYKEEKEDTKVVSILKKPEPSNKQPEVMEEEKEEDLKEEIEEEKEQELEEEVDEAQLFTEPEHSDEYYASIDKMMFEDDDVEVVSYK